MRGVHAFFERSVFPIEREARNGRHGQLGDYRCGIVIHCFAPKGWFFWGSGACHCSLE